MKNLYILAFLIGLCMNSTLSWSQSSDTTDYWRVPIWKARALMNIALRQKACDSLVVQQQKENQRLLEEKYGLTEQLIVRSISIASLKNENKAWEDRFNIQVAVTKTESKKKRNWALAAVLGFTIAVLEAIP